MLAQILSQAKDAYERCRKRYPTVELPFDSFLARIEITLAEASAEAEPPAMDAGRARFNQLHHEDLFLAHACAAGNRIAWEYFADEYLPLLQRCAAHACKNHDEGRDLAQEIIASMLGGSSSDGPRSCAGKLSTYNGRGSLAGWLRVATARAAIDRFRRSRREVPLDEAEESGREVPASSSASGEDRLDARWAPILSRLLTREIELLAPRERLLLSLYYLHSVPLHRIGAQFGVHEATASRWLETLRSGIRKRVEKELKRRHGLRPRELQSLWHWVSEGEGLSLEKLLVK